MKRTDKRYTFNVYNEDGNFVDYIVTYCRELASEIRNEINNGSENYPNCYAGQIQVLTIND